MTAFYLRAATALVPFVLFAIPAAAQDSQRPVVITPPVGDFSLPPTGQTPTPRPSPTPTPTTTPTPAPIVQPIPIPTPAATATPAPRRSVPRAVPAPAPITAPEATPAPSPSPSPVVSESPAQGEPAPGVAATPPAAGAGLPGWFWPALGGVLLLGAGGVAGWWLGGRRRRREAEGEQALAMPPEPAEVPVPSPGPPPLARQMPPAPPASPRIAPAAPAVLPPEGPLVVEMRPLRAGIREGMVTVEFELFVHNRGPEPADNIRATLALLGANAEQDAQIASLHAAARMAAGSEPFSVAPGATHMLTGQVTLPGERMQVVTVQGKPMFVPIVPVTLRWYAGLSIRTLRDAFMVGTAPAQGGDKLGPLWVERAAEGFGRLAAKRYVPKVAQ